MSVRVALLAAALIAVVALPATAEARKRASRVEVATAPVADAIPLEIGRQGTAGFNVNLAVPAGLDAARFDALVATTARRWGLSRLGTTTDVPLAVDRRNTVGFSTATGADVLGVQRDSIEVTRSRATGRVLARRIVDQDLALNASVPWQQGPEHPGAAQYDLETVLIHELGHMAGNKEHAAGCVNTPMLASAAPGDWWRSPLDWSWAGACAATEPAAAATPTARAARAIAGGAPIRHETRVVVRYVAG